MTQPNLSELFARDPFDISDAEFEQHVLPALRKARSEFLVGEAAGKKAPSRKKTDAPASLSLKDLLG